ncbi:AsmA family protein [Fodinicurvata halophila]|uniref:AsmA family protein n=1 Tax=Fodinicurvata halophila TaxID=1419723 RepID=UPI00362C6AC5
MPELHAASNFSLEEGTWQYDTRLESESARLHLEGTTEDIDIGYPVTAFRFEFMHPENAAVLPRLMDRNGEQLPGVEARGQAEASPRAIELGESELLLSEDSLDMGGELVFSGRRPEINLSLQGDRLDLASLQAFLPPARAEAPESSEWPEAPLPLGFLRGYQGRLDLNLQRLETSWQPLENLGLSAGLADNRLQFEELSAEVLGGRFSATGSLLADSTGNYGVDLDGNLAEASAGSLSSPLFGSTPLEGRLDLPFSLSTDGESITRMLRNLEGSVDLSGRLQFPAGDQEAGMPTGVGETTPDTLFALLDYPAEAAGNLQIESGRLTSQDLKLSGARRQLVFRGMLADLPRRQIRTTAELFEENQDTPQAIMDIVGPLGDPAFRWQRFGRSLSQSIPQNAQASEQTGWPATQ